LQAAGGALSRCYSVAVLRGWMGYALPDFWLAPSSVLNFMFKFVGLTYTANNFQPAKF